jgi:protein ImuB
MSASSRRYLSVWLRRLATDRIAKRFAPDEALIIAAPVKGALRLSAVNDAAAALGLRAGMPLADARAMHPAIAVAQADERADLALLEAVADWCDRYTPLVGLDAPDGLLLDVTGCAHLFGGEAALARDLVRQLARRGLQARAAVAGTVGCAWGVARHSASLPPPERGRSASAASRVGVVASGEERHAIAPLPLTALRLDTDTITALAQVGLKHVADVLDRPRAPLAARFGAPFVRRIDQALGLEDEPITPRLPVPAALAEQRFPEPIAHERDVLGTIERLAVRLAHVLEQRGEGARLLQVVLFRADGKVFRLEAGTGAPLREPRLIARLFADRLDVIGDEVDPGFGFDIVRLCALVTERSDPQQTGLATPDHDAELAHLIDRLGARFGLRRVMRQMPQDTHIPEFAVTAVAAASLPSPLRGGSTAVAQRRRSGWGSEFLLTTASNSHDPPPQPSPARGEERESLPSRSTPPSPPARSACSRGRSRSMQRPNCPTDRRRNSPGGVCATSLPAPKARSALRCDGGATKPAAHSCATISGSRAVMACGSGFSMNGRTIRHLRTRWFVHGVFA